MTASVFNGLFARKKAPAPPPKASELWEALDEPMPEAARVRGAGIGLLRRSPLARKILAFNLGVLLAIICTVLILVPRVFGSDSNDRQGLMKQVGLAALVLAPLGPEAPLDARAWPRSWRARTLRSLCLMTRGRFVPPVLVLALS